MKYCQKWTLIVFFGVIASQLSAQDKKSLSFKTIDRAGYSISCPVDWSVDTSKMMGTDIFLRSRLTDSLDRFAENMNVVRQDLNGYNYDLLKMGQESEAQLSNIITDVTILESRLDSSGPVPFYSMRFTGRHGKFQLLTIQRYFLKDNIGYAITFTIQIGKEDQFMPTAEKMLSSFVLVGGSGLQNK